MEVMRVQDEGQNVTKSIRIPIPSNPVLLPCCEQIGEWKGRRVIVWAPLARMLERNRVMSSRCAGVEQGSGRSQTAGIQVPKLEPKLLRETRSRDR
ncbi:hypothetical protein B0H19DRAFT_1123319 [Mycena capillaripes]|nr:hypothetical protein B0H19DRAFT_1123319 [Mycena capillaripes]